MSSVTDNSAAAKAGLKAGDVITNFNGSTINDPQDLRRRIQSLDDGDEFTVTVTRDRKPLTLKGKAESPERRSTQATRPRASRVSTSITVETAAISGRRPERSAERT